MAWLNRRVKSDHDEFVAGPFVDSVAEFEWSWSFWLIISVGLIAKLGCL